MQRIYYKIFILFFITAFAGWAGELDELILQAVEGNPLIQSQRAVVEQFSAAHREVLEFWDPSLFASAGYGSQLRGLPLSSARTSDRISPCLVSAICPAVVLRAVHVEDPNVLISTDETVKPEYPTESR